MKPFACLVFCAVCGVAPISSAFALINIQPMVSEVREKAVTVEISNTGDRAEYVSIALSRVLNPGVELADESLESIGKTLQPKLYVAPFKLQLAPGQSKTITLKPLVKIEQEQVYRLDIKPVVSLLDPKLKTIAGNVVVNLAFSALVRHIPVQETSTLTIKCEAGGGRFFATGNTRAHVEGVTVNGEPIDPFNVYPGVPLLLKGARISVPDQPECIAAGPAR